MNRNYSTVGEIAVAADTALTVIGSASVQPAIFYLSLSCGETPSDAAADCSVKHFTADGTGTAVTPQPFVGGGIAATSTSKKTYTVEPTYSGIELLKPTFNQRSSYQWYANPGKELIPQLAAGDGIGIIVDAFNAATFTVDAVFHFTE